MDREFDRAFSQDMPEDFKNVMNKMRNHHNQMKNEFQRGRFYDDEEDFDYNEQNVDKKSDKYDFKKMIYRIYAPALWEKAQMADARRHGHHGPNVMADKKDAVKDWPKMNAMCPVILFFIFACIHQVCRIKFLEKELAKLEFLQKAKKLVKKSVKKASAIVAKEQQPVHSFSAPVEQVQVVAQMPVAQKKCKKAAKVVSAQPQFVMPIFQKKIDDVEAIPQVNESFDYSMTDPLVDEMTYEPDTMTSSTGISASRNSMM